MRRPLRLSRLLLLAVTALAVTVGAALGLHARADWRTASREPVGLAPDPALVADAVVQVYGARTVGAKGVFGVHSWVATKRSGAAQWMVYEVIGWRLGRAPSVVVMRERAPDGRWFGSAPQLYADRRGPGVDALIERIEQAAQSYPHAGEYRAWPGPNSNTFTAWIARAVPELQVDLPATAIGKDYLGGAVFGTAPSGSGVALSLGGLLGVAAGPVDGIEINLLGLNFGVNARGLKLPIVGRIGSELQPGS
jgi:hypothetical protein